jgi:hypothetical protein
MSEGPECGAPPTASPRHCSDGRSRRWSCDARHSEKLAKKLADLLLDQTLIACPSGEAEARAALSGRG